jgi:hypothetical protein
MTRSIARTLAVLVTAIVLAASGAAHAAPSTTQANGQGTLDGGARHFSFSAKQAANGTVSGTATLTNKNFTGENGTSPYKLQIDIVCMKRFGNTVYFGGNTRRTNDPNLVDAVFFAVQDNGEPGKSDKISRAFFWDDDPNTTGDPMTCLLNQEGDFPLETIEGGNVQVK